MAWEDIDGASMAVVSVEDAGDSVLVSGRGAGSIGTPPGWAGGGLGVRMTRAREHCDDTVMEHCYDKNSGAL